LTYVSKMELPTGSSEQNSALEDYQVTFLYHFTECGLINLDGKLQAKF